LYQKILLTKKLHTGVGLKTRSTEFAYLSPKKMAANPIKWCEITILSVSLQIQNKCYMAADMKLTVDKVVVNAQWHVHEYNNITSIIQ
jgi:hypothetical protein